MTSYILDASVAAKWFLGPPQESLVPQAFDLLQSFTLGECRLLVPDLFWCEIGNILRKAVKQDRLTESQCMKAIAALEAIQVVSYPARPLLRNAMRIAGLYDRSVYDATYAALAIEMDAVFITADERLVNSLAARFPVRWLGMFVA